MDNLSTLTTLVLLFAIHSFCRAEYAERVILVPPEKLGFVINPDADPFSNKSPTYLSMAKPLKDLLEEQIDMKFPDGSKTFYDINSRALYVSSSAGVVDALASALRITMPSNVVVDIRTYESRQSVIAAGENQQAIADQATVVSRNQFLTLSAQTGSLRINAPDSITKSGGLTCRISPTVGEELDLVDAEITLTEDNPAMAPALPDPSGKPALLKTRLLLRFNTSTTLYEHQLPSGGYFGVRLTFNSGHLDTSQKPDGKPSESSGSPQR
jgi:hypothetical protein